MGLFSKDSGLCTFLVSFHVSVLGAAIPAYTFGFKNRSGSPVKFSPGVAALMCGRQMSRDQNSRKGSPTASGGIDAAVSKHVGVRKLPEGELRRTPPPCNSGIIGMY